MVRVKICGITTPQDAVAAAIAGADAIGLNFVKGPRKITAEQAAQIVAALPPFCTPVALVNIETNPLGDDLWRAISELRINVIQLYGDRQDECIAPLLRDGFSPLLVHQIIPDAFPNDLEERILRLAPVHPHGIVFDTHDPVQLGGTGKTFDWSILKKCQNVASSENKPHMILAGGLNPTNVADAVRIAQPRAVDVSSGVEDSPGFKSVELMTAFVQNARNACG